MTTDAHRPGSRIPDAPLPPSEPTGRDADAPGVESAPGPARRGPLVPPRPTEPPPTAERPTTVPSARPTTVPSARPTNVPSARPAPTVPAPPPGLPPRPSTAPSTAPVAAIPPRPASAPRTGAASDRATGPRPAPAPAPAAGIPPRPGVAVPRPGTAGDDVHRVETTTRLRPIRDAAPGTDAVPRSAQTYGTYGAYRAFTAPPETPVETTTRLRPIRERRVGRVVAAGACLVLGVGLLGGALAGAVLAATDAGATPEPEGYTEAGTLWHSVPVDTLFPRTLAGPRKGPGAADRTWTRIVVAPDTPCTAAVLPKSVLTTLGPVGCDRVLRATYTDATSSSVITVGLVFTQADPTTSRTLATGSAARLAADVPPALAGPGTVAARFGPAQRASWSTRALADLPVLVTAVSGFADGRPVATPEPAAKAMADGQTSPTAQSGLGHEAKGVADQIERTLRATVATAAKDADT